MSRSIFHIAGIAVRELLYERVFYLLICFALFSLCMSLLLGQLTYAEQSRLTLDFMLAGTEISMTLFSVFMGISLFHREIALGSIAMVLSKPISRTTFLIGKFAGQAAVQIAVTLAMGALTLLIGSAYGIPSVLAVIQATFLTALEITVLTAVTYFFAVNAGALTAATATLCWIVCGHMHDTEIARTADFAEVSLWRLLRGLVPDLNLFNMKPLASYGFTLPWAQLGWACVYALVCIVTFLGIAAICFERKDILT